PCPTRAAKCRNILLPNVWATRTWISPAFGSSLGGSRITSTLRPTSKAGCKGTFPFALCRQVRSHISACPWLIRMRIKLRRCTVCLVLSRAHWGPLRDGRAMRCRLSLRHDVAGAVNESEGYGKMLCACDSCQDTGTAFFGNLQEKFI